MCCVSVNLCLKVYTCPPPAPSNRSLQRASELSVLVFESTQVDCALWFRRVHVSYRTVYRCLPFRDQHLCSARLLCTDVSAACVCSSLRLCEITSYECRPDQPWLPLSQLGTSLHCVLEHSAMSRATRAPPESHPSSHNASCCNPSCYNSPSSSTLCLWG